MTRGHKCDYKNQVNEELIDGAVSEVIKKLVSNPKFAVLMREKINMHVDTLDYEDSRQPQCPVEKEKAIKDALEHLGMI